MTIFVLTMLATVTFDGFKETPLWSDLLQWMAVAPPFHAFIRKLHDLGFDFQVVLETVVLALFPLLFLVVYLGFCWLSKQVAGGTRSVTDIAGLFVFSLVPIAIAYHLAHYLSYLLIAGQIVIPLTSDPFGVGWNIFGTADYGIDIGVIGPKFVWYTALIAIVVGHVFAVGVAHLVALRVYESAAAAVRSQYPFLVLMVAYTMVSLWILSQPIVGGPSLGNLRGSSGTLSLAPFEFREICLDLEPGERVRYDFLSERPIEFNIHYHDGPAIRYPVKITTAAVPSSTFVAETARSHCLMWFNRDPQETSLTYGVSGW
jgi:hypothetical protein